MKGKWKLAIFVLLVTLSAGAVAWHKTVRHEYIPRNFGIVDQGKVYRSGQLSERMLREVVKKYRIRSIVALNAAEPESDMEGRVASELGVHRFEYSLAGDGTGEPKSFAAVVNHMANPENQPVLVHCSAGAQRATTSVILYRHLVQGDPIAEAYPESFQYEHEPDDWKLLAYLADHLGQIRSEWTRLQSENKP